MDAAGSRNSLYLPEEIIEQILSRLPAKSVLKFRCVSKSWRSLIGTKGFVTKHLQNSKALAHGSVILHWKDTGLKQCYLDSLLNEGVIDLLFSERVIDSSPFGAPLNISSEQVMVVGCCDGLLCTRDRSGCFFLCNPSTRISKRLPDMWLGDDGLIFAPGFGRVESSGEYKVFVSVLVSKDRHFVGKVYSSKTHSWKILYQGFLSLSTENGVLLNGKLHWERREIGERRNIVSFDLQSEVFETIELPCGLSESWFPLTLGVLGGSLSVLYSETDTDVDIRIMKEYGVKESWIKLVAPLQPPFSAPFGIGRNGEVCLIYGSPFLVYYPKNDVFRFIRNDVFRFIRHDISLLNVSFFGVFHYVESLVSTD